MAEVTFTVDDEGQPIHEDATITIRPRLFLEGNFFLDLQPGSPSAPELVERRRRSRVTQTATAVQLDEILTALQSDTRDGPPAACSRATATALNHEPTAAEDATQDPEVQGLTGGRGDQQTFRYGGKAGRDTAIVNEALLGQQPHDLSSLIRGPARPVQQARLDRRARSAA